MTRSTQKEQPKHTEGSDSTVMKRIFATVQNVPPSTYAPREDSLLMIEALSHMPLEGRNVLDVGTGSGILGLYCAMHNANVTASDIDHAAIEQVRRSAASLGVQLKLVISNLFSKVPGRFSLILFNPPYLPSKDIEDRTVDGGLKGTFVVDRFLNDLPAHLEKRGQALLLLSSLNDPASVKRRHTRLTFSRVVTRPLFFEELQVLRVRPRNDLPV